MSVSGSLKRHRKLLLLVLLASLAYTSAAVLLTWPLATRMGTYYFSAMKPCDGIGVLAENVYNEYAGKADLKGPVTDFFAYPFGYDRRGAPNYPLTQGVLNQLTRVIGPEPAYNLLVLLSFPLAGLAMLALVYYLTKSATASFLGGFLFSFSPWHTYRLFDQLSLSGIYVIPLFVLGLVVFTRRKDLKGALLLALVSVVAVLTDFHFGLICAITAGAWVATLLLYSRPKRVLASFAGRSRSNGRTALLILLVIAIVFAVSTPFLANVLYKDPTVFKGEVRGAIYQEAEFAASWWNYVVPPADSVLWGNLVRGFVVKRLGLRISLEVASYPGIITVVLAVLAFILPWRRRKREPNEPEAPGPPSDGNRVEFTSNEGLMSTVRVFCLVAGVTAFLLSLPPLMKVGSVRIPTPSILVSSLVPFFRYFSRWSVLVIFSVCLLGAIGFLELVRTLKWTGKKPWALLLALLALFALDVAIVPPLRSEAILNRPPETLRALARYPSSEPIVIYPLVQSQECISNYYRYSQKFHHHPMLNGTKNVTEADQYRMAVSDVYSPYTPKMLAGLGIKKAVVLTGEVFNGAYDNSRYMATFDPSRMPDGYELVERTDDGYIYDVVAPPASVFPLYYSGFSPPGFIEGGTSWTAMLGASSRMLLVNKGKARSHQFSIVIYNPGQDNRLVLKLGGKEIGQYGVPSGTSRLITPPIELKPGRSFLDLQWDGRVFNMTGSPLSAVSRTASLFVSTPDFQ